MVRSLNSHSSVRWMLAMMRVQFVLESAVPLFEQQGELRCCDCVFGRRSTMSTSMCMSARSKNVAASSLTVDGILRNVWLN